MRTEPEPRLTSLTLEFTTKTLFARYGNSNRANYIYITRRNYTIKPSSEKHSITFDVVLDLEEYPEIGIPIICAEPALPDDTLLGTAWVWVKHAALLRARQDRPLCMKRWKRPLPFYLTAQSIANILVDVDHYLENQA